MNDTFLFILGICFIVVVIPYWLKLHYQDDNSKKAKSNSKSEKFGKESENQDLSALSDLADSLNQRVIHLEKILDAQSPEWRTKYE